MKNLLTIISFFLLTNIFSQANNPVKWRATYTALSATEGEVVLTATIDKGWHTYSQRPTDAGPVPTSISFIPDKTYKLIGKTEETDAHEEFVPAFEAKIFVFKDKAEFKQKIKHTASGGYTVKCKVEYMCCDDKMCLPPKTVDLALKVQ